MTENMTSHPPFTPSPVGGTTSDGSTPSVDGRSFKFDDYTQHVILSILFIIICALGVFGNSLVVLGVFLCRKLRTVTNVFVVNLAVADLLTCMTIPWNAVALLSKGGWPLPEWVCVVVALVSFTCVGCSLFTLATIAINRWLVITHALHAYRRVYTPLNLALMIVAIWTIPFLVALIPPLIGLGELGYAEKYSTCSHKTTHELSDYYSVLQALIFYPVPLIIIIVCYVKVYLHVRRHTKAMTEQAEGSSSSMHASLKRQSSHQQMRLSRRQLEITKNLFYVVLAFFICITPYGVALMIPPSDPAIPWTAAILLCNSCINPIIYATKHPNFKLVFRCMLTCQCSKIPEQSEFLRSVRYISSQQRNSR
ncbi:5-hydroxytryptamine receptor 4-like [Diadema antillarum]|uniref:5-hydroxytryptamine receptor 4-like n=1 Tax=Diadema antillarum TaxID=105358 RepID=UPI003A894E33